MHQYDHQHELRRTGQGCVGSRGATGTTAGEEGRRVGEGRERWRWRGRGGQGCVGSRGATGTTAGEEGRRGKGEREGEVGGEAKDVLGAEELLELQQERKV